MNKILLVLSLISSFAVSTQAATCDVSTSRNAHRNLNQIQIKDVYFGRPTVVNINKKIQITFTLSSVAVNPDNTNEYIEISGTDSSECDFKILFDAKNIYNGVSTACYGKAALPGFDLISVACRY